MHAYSVSLAASTGRQCLSGLRGERLQRQRRSRAAAAPTAGFFDDIFDRVEKELNFESWAPKSSQAWRLGKDVNSKSEFFTSPGRAFSAPARHLPLCRLAGPWQGRPA